MRGVLGGRAGMALAFLLGLVIATAGTATAARLITGKQIKDGSVASRDLSKSVRKQIAKTGTPGPRGAKGDPGPSTGAAGGDLTGSYPDPSLRRSTAVTVREQPGPSCVTTFDILCGDGGANSWYARRRRPAIAPLSYAVEPGGLRPVPGRRAAGRAAASRAAWCSTCPPGRRPARDAAASRVRSTVTPQPAAVHVRVGDNGEVSLHRRSTLGRREALRPERRALPGRGPAELDRRRTPGGVHGTVSGVRTALCGRIEHERSLRGRDPCLSHRLFPRLGRRRAAVACALAVACAGLGTAPGGLRLARRPAGPQGQHRRPRDGHVRLQGRDARLRPADVGAAPGLRLHGRAVGGEGRAGQPLHADRRRQARPARSPAPGRRRTRRCSRRSSRVGRRRCPRRRCATGAPLRVTETTQPAGLPHVRRLHGAQQRLRRRAGTPALDAYWRAWTATPTTAGGGDGVETTLRFLPDTVPAADRGPVDGHLHVHEHLPRAGEGAQGLRHADQRRPSAWTSASTARTSTRAPAAETFTDGDASDWIAVDGGSDVALAESGAAGTVLTDYDATLECRSGTGGTYGAWVVVPGGTSGTLNDVEPGRDYECRFTNTGRTPAGGVATGVPTPGTTPSGRHDAEQRPRRRPPRAPAWPGRPAASRRATRSRTSAVAASPASPSASTASAGRSCARRTSPACSGCASRRRASRAARAG